PRRSPLGAFRSFCCRFSWGAYVWGERSSDAYSVALLLTELVFSALCATLQLIRSENFWVIQRIQEGCFTADSASSSSESAGL
uniref:Uncharacterized protein n=1 Tax=Triticum urartu TaxID=4572 RepID=A0A8R7PJY5_TRIUA